MVELGLLAQELNDAAMSANAKLDRRFVEAMNNHDVEGAMACFIDTPDLVVVICNEVLQDPTDLRQFLTKLFSSMRVVHGELNEIKHWILGETVFAAGTATYEFEALDGSRSTLRERWTDARQKVAGKWVYVLCHATQVRDRKPPVEGRLARLSTGQFNDLYQRDMNSLQDIGGILSSKLT